MVFNQERVECPLWVRDELLTHVEFMYLCVLFPSEESRRLTDAGSDADAECESKAVFTDY